MKSTSLLLTAACAASLSLCGMMTALGASKKDASPSPSPSASPTAKATASPKEKAPRAIPFRGMATAIDQSAKTFTIAGKETSRVFKVTDKTTVTKGGNPATMADLMDNEAVTGSYWKQEDGTLEAKSLKIGGKSDADKASSAQKSKKADDAMASPSPSPKN